MTEVCYPTTFVVILLIMDETRPGMVSSNWVGYIVCNTHQIVFKIMFVVYVGVNLFNHQLTLHNVI